jgi:uncharacterized protein (DUF2252 family)
MSSAQLPTADDRAAAGKARRAEVPRTAHAEPTLAPSRDPLALLAAQDDTRMPELLPLRYGRMAASPFAFYRGAAAIMAADLAGSPATGLTAQICGDAHLSNFGFFASPERRLVFDLNDFDETLPGPWEWDVKRLAASVEVAGRSRGFTDAERRTAVLGCVRAYRTAMQTFAEQRTLEVWYARADVAELLARSWRSLARRQRKRLGQVVAKSRSRDHLGALARFATTDEDGPRLVADPPLVVPAHDLPGADELTADMTALLDGYRASLPRDRRVLFDQFRLVDIARKVVGVGSVGTRSFMLLLVGRDARDPLFLQAKEAGASVLEEHLGPSPLGGGERVVTGQRIMQAVGDILLGWQTVNGVDGHVRDFYVRQLRDWKGSLEVDIMIPDGLSRYAGQCGWTLARAHARSGDRVAIAAYLGRGSAFDRAVAAFAESYADQNERDHAALLAAIDAGRIEVAPEPD